MIGGFVRAISGEELRDLPPDAREAHDDGYRAGYIAGHADALEAFAHLARRGFVFSIAVDRLRRFQVKYLRPWADAPRLDGEHRPDFCRRDRHGEHYDGDDDDDDDA